MTIIKVSDLSLGLERKVWLKNSLRTEVYSVDRSVVPAVEAGPVTSIALSADHSTIAGGHASGSIFIWELAKPAKPFLQVSPTDRSRVQGTDTDGHVSGVAILHVGFLGTRHTAFVSADDRGMAFSHLATRGMGIVARAVRTTRILGRYPDATPATARLRKPSSILAFSPLPLGNAEHSTDSMGLVAMLTPYLLVIVSTTPLAQTQHKASRPKELPAHSAMTAALAWFPAVKLKGAGDTVLEASSRVKLVYCWSNILTVLDVVDVETSDRNVKDNSPSLQFLPRSRWKSQEAIVATQWLSRSVLGVLTITQQLIILEDVSLHISNSSDLIQKHIYHVDLFSHQLTQVVEQLDEEDTSMHGVVADAFYMSFRAYKGRLFLLGFNDISMGTLSNWADRLLALMEEGNFIGAIELATSYFKGGADKVTVGLPDDDSSRHAMVREKLVDIMSASLKYAFGKNQEAGTPRVEQPQLEELATACIAACLGMNDPDFLFEEVYAWYEDGQAQGIFLEILEPYITNNELQIIPPSVLKDLVGHFIGKGLANRLEEMLCHLDPQTMDIDQITTLCKQNRLYDALIYVWNQALGDYTTLVVYFLGLAKIQAGSNGNADIAATTTDIAGASKIFPYLSYVLTGRIYPTGSDMGSSQAVIAKADVYHFLFSGGGNSIAKGDRTASAPVHSHDGSYPILRSILDFDAPSFLSVLNEAFEDSFLNGSADRLSGDETQRLTESQRFGMAVNRQYIVSILLEVMTAPRYDNEDTVFLDMFIARNLPKFPQFILLSGSILHRVLLGLCDYPEEEVAEDCQLSVEYLLSMYHPPDIASLMPSFRKARFYRVLKGIYKAEKQYAQLLRTCFQDYDHPDSIFDCIGDCLRPKAGLSDKQVKDVRAAIIDHAAELAEAGVTRAASILESYVPDLHGVVLDTLQGDDSAQFQYLRTVLEPGRGTSDDSLLQRRTPDRGFVEQYVLLMCDYEPRRVSEYVEKLKAGDLRLEEVLSSLESSGVVDAAVVLMAREGMVREAIDRLTQHLRTLEAALIGLLDGAADSPDTSNTEEAAEDLLNSIQKYARVGVWLCQGHTKTARRSHISGKQSRQSRPINSEPSMDEEFWLDLIDTIVGVTKNVSSVVGTSSSEVETANKTSVVVDLPHIIASMRTVVQETFTALLATTSSARTDGSTGIDLSFLRILRAFLGRAAISSPSLSDLRAVLGAIFSAYSYEESLLALANNLLDKDLFVHVAEAAALRRKGWRPLGQVCEGCGKRVWGPGAGGNIWEAWERKNKLDAQQRNSKTSLKGPLDENVGRGKGKAAIVGNETKTLQSQGKVRASQSEDLEDRPGGDEGITHAAKEDLGPLVIFSCRHIFHRSCIDEMQPTREEEKRDHLLRNSTKAEFACPLCT